MENRPTELLHKLLSSGTKADLRDIHALLTDGADPNARRNRQSLLSLAINTQSTEIVEAVLNAGAKVRFEDFVSALDQGHRVDHLIKLLLTHGGNLNMRGPDRKPLLHYPIGRLAPGALEENHRWNLLQLRVLLERGANPIERDPQGLIAVNLAFTYGSAEEIALLLKATNSALPEIDRMDESGKTALHSACETGDRASAQRLIDRGASTYLLDARQHSPLSLAVCGNHHCIVELLISSGAEYRKGFQIKGLSDLRQAATRGLLGNVVDALGRIPTPALGEMIDACGARFIAVLLHRGSDTRNFENRDLPDDYAALSVLAPYLSDHPQNVVTGDRLVSYLERAEHALSLINVIRNDHPEWTWDALRFAESSLKTAAPAWSFRTFNLPTKFANRRRSMLAGPLFTCAEHPWPKGVSGKPASPLLQIDLELVRNATGVDFGSGLFQAWMVDWKAAQFRIIPKETALHATLLDDVPRSEDDFEPCPGDNFLWLSWPEPMRRVQQISGLKGPHFSMHFYSNGLPENPPHAAEELIRILEQIAGGASGNHLFGTFYQIQYSHADVGKPVFISLDSSDAYGWGDSGTAQIFYEQTANGPRFSFDWSCY